MVAPIIYGGAMLATALTRFICSPAGANLVRSGGQGLTRAADAFVKLVNSNAGPQVIRGATKNFISLIRSNPALRQDFQKGLRQSLIQVKNDIIPGAKAWFTKTPMAH